MEEVIRHPEEVPTWEAAGRGAPVDWRTFLAPWGSAVDFPAAFYYAEIAAAFPEAGVILTIRDPGAWFDSFSTTIRPMMTGFPARVIVPLLPLIRNPRRVTRHPEMERLIRLDREEAMAMFVAHGEAVKQRIPPERLLVFDVKEGWGPLCAFLGVPVPDEPFPRVNDALTFQRRTRAVQAISWVVLLAPVAVAAAMLGWWLA
jgi:hypothetical protein